MLHAGAESFQGLLSWERTHAQGESKLLKNIDWVRKLAPLLF
jgi:hypothetical protein